jgi:hypothetical protein
VNNRRSSKTNRLARDFIKKEVNLMRRVIEAAKIFFEELYENTSTVVGVSRCEEGWELMVEVLTDDDYTKKRAKNDLISVFKVYMDTDLQVISYSREEIRERGKVLEKSF